MKNGLRLHFTDGTSALDGTIGGGQPTEIDDDLARDIARGWPLGMGDQLPDGRVIRCVEVEAL